MSPVAHEFPGRPGRNVSSKKSTFKIKRGLLALKLNREMWRIVISEKHSDNNPEER
jgi:hypothetical protein